MSKRATLCLAAAAACAALIVPASAGAQAFKPNKLGDTAPNGCTASDCTLREAVIAANDRAGADTILLQRRIYTLTIAPAGPNDDASGDLNVTDTLTVKRAKPPRHAPARLKRKFATVDFNEIDGGFNAYSPAAAQLTISGLSILDADQGILGGVAKQLKVSDSRVRGSESDDYGLIAYGPATIARDTIGPTGRSGMVLFAMATVNMTRVVGTGDDAIVHPGGASLDRLTAENTRISGSVGTGLIDLSTDGMTVLRTRVTGNKAGGVISTSPGGLVMRNDVVSGNRAQGGVIAVGSGPIELTRTTVSGNSSNTNGGGMVYAGSGTLTVQGSTLSGNSSDGAGGGLLANGSNAVLVNDTIAGNSAKDNGGGLLAANSGATEVNAVTVIGNHANTDNSGGDGGGGILESGFGITIHNTVIAQNTVGTGGVGPNCLGVFTSAGHNLRGSADSPTCTGFTGTGDVVNPAPKLGALRSNGGPTRTACPLKGSPLIDKAGSDAPGRDQRGRKRGAKPDIGACERIVRKRKHGHR